MGWGVANDLLSCVRDPICGAAIRAADAAGRRTLGEATFYFCSSGCRDRFDRLGAEAADGSERPRLRWVELPLVELDARRAAPRLGAELGAVPGVRHAAVNGSEQLAVVGYDPAVVGLPAVVAAARQAGYAVRTAAVRLEIRELRCPFCAGLVERALRDVPGVLRASADPVAGQARVEHVLGLAGPDELAAAVEAAGLRVDPAGRPRSTRSAAA